MDSKNNGEVRKSKKISQISSKLNCANGQQRSDENIYPKSDTKANVLNKDTANNSLKGTNIIEYKSWQPETYINGHEHSYRNFVKNIISSPFIDAYEPSHQFGPDYIIPTENVWTSSRDVAVKLRITDSGPAATPPISIVTYFRNAVLRCPTRNALSVKRNGKWVHWTWIEYQRDVHIAAKAFIKLGLERFHGVAILGFNSPEWSISNLAAIFAGGLSSGIYLTNSSAACAYILKNSEANIVVVDDDQQLQKILEVRDQLPHLKAIIQYIGEPTAQDVFSWKEIIEIGRTVPDEVLERRIKSLAINQCCTLIYTSGTTGEPKGAMLTHDNLYYASTYIAENWELVNHIRYISFLPLSHITAQIADIYTHIAVFGSLYFAQPDALKGSLVETLKEVKPDVFLGVPRVYEKICERIIESVTHMSFLKKHLINWALKSGKNYTKSCLKNQPVVPRGYAIVEKTQQKIRDAVGIKNTKYFFSGGVQLPKEIQEFYLSLNIITLEVYGMSECSGPHLMNTRKNYCLGSVGKNTAFMETRLHQCNDEGHGEVCLRGRHMFSGYLNDEHMNVEAYDYEGWFHSGDIGWYNEDGFLFITGRIKELIITAGGENIAPVPIENSIKEHLPIISQAVLVGDKRKFLSMLLTFKTEIDVDTLIPTNRLTSGSCYWCQCQGSNATTIEDIVYKGDSKVMAAIQEAIDKVNQNAMSNAQRIQKWTILPNDFSIPGGEIGPSLKLKRSFIVDKYRNVIDEFYRN